MASEWDVVDVWVGLFPNQQAFDEYVRELPRDDLEDPLSEFISDMGQPWYDRDFMGAHFHGDPSPDVQRLLATGHAFASSYAGQAAEAYRRLGLGPVNATITVWGEEVRRPRSVQRRAYRLAYLGRFPCKPDAT
jgi:hypothetical protein